MRIVRALLAVLALPAVASPGSGDPVSRTVIGLEDGSLVPVDGAREPLRVRTAYGELRVALKDIRSLHRTEGSEFVLQTSGLTATVDLASTDLELDTGIGRLKVPLTELKSITSGPGPLGLADDRTVSLWSFPETSAGVCIDAIRHRRMALSEMDLVSDREGMTAAVARGEGSSAEVPADPDLEFAGKDFTLEARVKLGKSTRAYTSLFWKCDGVQCDYCFLVQNNGALYAGSSGASGSCTLTTPPSLVKPDEWSYVAMVVEAKTQSVSFYVNGCLVSCLKGQFHAQSAGAVPLCIGMPSRFGNSFSAPAAIQLIRISKSARTAEEIREAGRLLELRSPQLPGRLRQGVRLRGGGYLRARTPGLSGARFRTAWGSLVLSENFGGEIDLYRHRPSELPKVQDRAREALRRLGASGIADREDAARELLEFGELAVPGLKSAQTDWDPEVRCRAEALLAALEKAGITRRPASDVLRWGESEIFGWLELDALDLVSRFGTHRAPLSRLEVVALGEVPLMREPLIRLKSGEKLQLDPPPGEILEIETALGPLKLPWSEVSSLRQDADQKSWRVETRRLVAAGTISPQELKFETQAGVLVVPLGEILEMTRPEASPR